MTPYEIINLDFATVQIQEHFAISTIAEGTTINNEKLDMLFDVFSLYYKDRPFVSIANRKNDYAIDPNLLSTRKHSDLIALAVVCYNDATKEIALFEQQFYTSTYKILIHLKKPKYGP